MSTIQRRKRIEFILRQATEAVSASSLSEQLQVSRQIIVGDIALLRAQGLDILSTPKGYITNFGSAESGVTFKIACLHGTELAKKELYTIVDYGGKLIDVIVEHPIYGQLVGQLNISSRYDADDFINKVNTQNARLLSDLTEGIHLHTISCKDEDCAARIKSALQELNVLLSDK